MAKTYQQVIDQAEQIRTETAQGANTAQRVGGTIKDAVELAHTETEDAKTNLKNDLAKKQDKLVSGSNIKTINGESILGSGNIQIQGGGGDGGLSEKLLSILITAGITVDTRAIVDETIFDDNKILIDL